MSHTWKYKLYGAKEMLSTSNETNADIYLERLLLFPIDIQNKIIEDISQLPQCTIDSVANIMSFYSVNEC